VFTYFGETCGKYINIVNKKISRWESINKCYVKEICLCFYIACSKRVI
jgi:hypothetical protein